VGAAAVVQLHRTAVEVVVVPRVDRLIRKPALCARLTAGHAVGAVTDTCVGATGYGEGTA